MKLRKKELQKLSKFGKYFLRLVYLGFFIFLKAAMIGFIGWGMFYVILQTDPVGGYKYAMWASHAVSGLLWLLLTVGVEE